MIDFLLPHLSYLHTCEPAIVHGNLSCDTIFIQHNGLIKIGCIAPDIVNTHVKTCVGHDLKFSRNIHFIAPEINQIVVDDHQTTSGVTQSSTTSMTTSSSSPNSASTTSSSAIFINKQSKMNNTAVDIYSFGMVALEVGFSCSFSDSIY